MEKEIDDQTLWDYLDGILSDKQAAVLERQRQADVYLDARISSLKSFNTMLVSNLKVGELPSASLKVDLLLKLSSNGTAIKKFWQFDPVWMYSFKGAVFLCVLCVLMLVLWNPLNELNTQLTFFLTQNGFSIITGLSVGLGITLGRFLTDLRLKRLIPKG